MNLEKSTIEGESPVKEKIIKKNIFLRKSKTRITCLEERGTIL